MSPTRNARRRPVALAAARSAARMEGLENRRMFALLGLGLEFPLSFLENRDSGALTYNATTGTLQAVSTPVLFFLDENTAPADIAPPSGALLELKLTTTGVLDAAGNPGIDFQITGQIDIDGDTVMDYTGLLLQGEATEFGFVDSGNTDSYEVRLTPTGGALFAPYFTGKDIGVNITSEGSTFTGSFAADFSGNVKAIVAPIPSLPREPEVGSISGKKFRDLTGNGLTADDTALGGVTIQLFRDVNNSGTIDAADGAMLDSKITGSDGSFLFSGLTPGQYLVREIVPTGWVRTSPSLTDTQVVVVEAGVEDKDVNFANFDCRDCANTRLSNIYYVINGKTRVTNLRGNTNQGDTVQVFFTVAANSAPATVSLVSYTAPTARFSASNANQQRIFDVDTGTFAPGGTYSLTVVNPNGFYQVDFVCGPVIDIFGPAGSNQFYTPQRRLYSADNDGTRLLDPTRSAISGFVFNDANKNGRFDLGERGISGVRILLTGTADDGSVVNITVTTNSDGRYFFTNLKAGNYNIRQTTQPSGFVDGTLTAGDNGGTISDDLFSNVRVEEGDAAAFYNFGEIFC